MTETPKFPVRFKEHSNQYFAKGWCHGVGIDEKGPFALLQYETGEVTVRYLNGCYHVEFETDQRRFDANGF